MPETPISQQLNFLSETDFFLLIVFVDRGVALMNGKSAKDKGRRDNRKSVNHAQKARNVMRICASGAFFKVHLPKGGPSRLRRTQTAKSAINFPAVFCHGAGPIRQ